MSGGHRSRPGMVCNLPLVTGSVAVRSYDSKLQLPHDSFRPKIISLGDNWVQLGCALSSDGILTESK